MPALGWRAPHCAQGHEFTPENTLESLEGNRRRRRCRLCREAKRRETRELGDWRPVDPEAPYMRELAALISAGEVRHIPDAPRYLVSDRGAVYGPSGLKKPTISTNGYAYVRIAERSRYVHALVLEAFVGPRPPGADTLHANDIRTDNRLENLSWGSRSENMLGAVERKRHHQTRKTHCPRGHEYTPENTYVKKYSGRTERRCRTCNSTREAA